MLKTHDGCQWWAPYLLHTLTFGDPLVAYFHSWVTEALDEVSRVQTHQVCNLVCICNGFSLGEADTVMSWW